MNLISLSDITEVTGLDDYELNALIPYAQSQATSLLGALEEESKSKSIYISESTDILRLEDSFITSIDGISYTTSGSSDPTDIESTDYRTIIENNSTLIIFDSLLTESSIVTISYKKGWTSSNLPNLVKLLLIVLTVNSFYSLHPDEAQHSQVLVSEKIGDYTRKFANMSKAEYKSLDEWVDYLVNLITRGPSYPDVGSAV